MFLQQQFYFQKSCSCKGAQQGRGGNRGQQSPKSKSRKQVKPREAVRRLRVGTGKIKQGKREKQQRGCLLTLDVEFLYTNIDQKEGLAALCYFLSNRPPTENLPTNK